MGRKKKAPEKLHKWHRLTRSHGAGKRKTTWNVTIDVKYGIDFVTLKKEMSDIEAEFGDQYEEFMIEPEDTYSYGDPDPYQTYYVKGLRWETNIDAEKLSLK